MQPQGMPAQGMPQQGMPQQGMPQQGMPQQGMPMKSDKDWVVLLLLSLFLGFLGADHFYAGKIGTGILKLLTFGGCGLWSIIDWIIIITGGFKDSNGLVVSNK